MINKTEWESIFGKMKMFMKVILWTIKREEKGK